VVLFGADGPLPRVDNHHWLSYMHADLSITATIVLGAKYK
jgi:hypothetical protein